MIEKSQSVQWFSYLEDLEGGQSRDLWGGGGSLETFSGEAQLKKTPCISTNFFMQYMINSHLQSDALASNLWKRDLYAAEDNYWQAYHT